MKTLRPNLDIDDFFQKVAVSPRRLLLLDYDGTLAPFRINRDEAVPYPGMREILRTLQESNGTRVVIVSGRSIRALLPLLSIDPTPEIWGSHGWERLSPGGRPERAPLEDRVVQALEAAWRIPEREGLTDRCERKHGCLALHWRGLKVSEIEEIRAQVRAKWRAIAEDAGLSLIDFDGGLELRAQGRNKATVTRTLLSEMGNNTMCAFLGDDLTDEEAFRELSGEHLGVLVRREFRATAAGLWLEPPGELVEFLEKWIDACSRRPDRDEVRQAAPAPPERKGDQS